MASKAESLFSCYLEWILYAGDIICSIFILGEVCKGKINKYIVLSLSLENNIVFTTCLNFNMDYPSVHCKCLKIVSIWLENKISHNGICFPLKAMLASLQLKWSQTKVSKETNIINQQMSCSFICISLNQRIVWRIKGQNLVAQILDIGILDKHPPTHTYTHKCFWSTRAAREIKTPEDALVCTTIQTSVLPIYILPFAGGQKLGRYWRWEMGTNHIFAVWFSLWLSHKPNHKWAGRLAHEPIQSRLVFKPFKVWTPAFSPFKPNSKE